jgi:hypothetical protein
MYVIPGSDPGRPPYERFLRMNRHSPNSMSATWSYAVLVALSAAIGNSWPPCAVLALSLTLLLFAIVSYASGSR